MRPTAEERSLHKENIVDYLNFDRKGPKRHCNKTLCSDGKNYSVHECVLGAVSDYFKTMFDVEMKEKYEEVVTVDNLPPKRLENMLEYIYSGDIEVTEENMLEVLEDSDYMQIKGLKSFCNRFMVQVVSADNCLKLRAYAQRYNLDDVLVKTDQSIEENFAIIVKHEDFMQLEVGEMSDIINQRNKNCEEAVFTGIVRWVNHNPLQREELFVNLFSQLNLSSMSSDFLAQVSTENLVKNNLVCANMLIENLVKLTHPSTKDSGKEFLVIGGQGSEKDCIVYDVNTKQPKHLPKLGTGRVGATSVKVGSKVYVVGGGDKPWRGNIYKTCEMFDLNEQSHWNQIPDMLEARLFCGSGLIDDHIYVTGGRNTEYLSSCEKFDIHNNKWIKMKNMLHERALHGTVVCDDFLYCIGGWDGTKHYSLCERYDVGIGKWEEIASLNEARSGLASVVLDGQIYAIGGNSDDGRRLSTVERYKPETNRWTMVASLQQERNRPSACVVGNKIFVIGGCINGGSISRSVEVYDPTLEIWTIDFEMEKPVVDATVVAI